MERIIMNEKTFELAFTGVIISDDRLVINMINVEDGLEQIEKIFNDTTYTERIKLVSESDTVIRIFKGFTKLVEVSKEIDVHIATRVVEDDEVEVRGDVVKVVLNRVSDVEKRVSDLEETVDILVLENLGVKEEK
nr:MAG TPA: hypothetical protein [Caudoviricetes sp.]